jgi:hypothetical protein
VRPRLSIGFLLVSLVACGDGLPTFPPVEPDAGIECTDETPCAAGQVCIQDRCHPMCGSDADCAMMEMCASSGICVARTMMRVDAGVDAGPIDLCEDVTCDPGVCHPEVGACVECLERASCPGSAPVCDISRGACRVFQPRVCSPCNVDGDCTDPMTMMDYGDCVSRTDEYEAVCAAPCTTPTECTAGLDCVAGHCLPRLGSCFAFNAALDGRGCFADVDCAAFGSSYVAAGQCAGAVVATDDGGVGTMGVCRQPCGIASDCPTGRACTDGFCVAM